MPTNKDIATKLRDVSGEFRCLADWLRKTRWKWMSNYFVQMAVGLEQLADEIGSE